MTKNKKQKKFSNFQKLVNLKNQARQKKIAKTIALSGIKVKRDNVIDLANISNRRVRKKLTKRNLFDLESDDEDINKVAFQSKLDE